MLVAPIRATPAVNCLREIDMSCDLLTGWTIEKEMSEV
jgi:hypothetical protein